MGLMGGGRFSVDFNIDSLIHCITDLLINQPFSTGGASVAAGVGHHTISIIHRSKPHRSSSIISYY